MIQEQLFDYLFGKAKLIPDVAAEELEKISNFFFDENKKFQIHAAKDINAIDIDKLAVWCNRNAIYCIPSKELIDFLQNEIGNQKAIEIGAGYGYVGEALGIISTDSYLQLNPEVRLSYELMRQPIINYPERVKRFEASEAVRRFKPDVVIGCWVTQKSIDPIEQSSRWGINEEEILRQTKKYIIVGHEEQHDQKKIRKYSHKIIKADWICSRAMNRDGNVIYIWDRNNC